MKVPLSKRLRACCNYITPGERIADVGTDHGYLGIWLLVNNIASSVIASDIVPGPLSSAKRNGEKFGCIDKMEFYLSNGVHGIPRDFDTLVCAGMGADTIISIISSASWLCDSKYKLILQCQSKTPVLRKYLSSNGFSIHEETIVRDGRFLYTVMEVVYQPGDVLSPGEWYFPPALTRNPSHELPAYYARVLHGLQLSLSAKKGTPQTDMVIALNELLSLPNDPALRFLVEETV